MAITLGDLRTFCAEVASHDISGDTSQREFMVWINGALQRLYSERCWHHIQVKSKIFLEVEETGSELILTQGSRTVSLGGAEVFLDKYVTDEWSLHIDSDGTQTWRLVSIDNVADTQATLEEGGNWPGASATSVAYAFVKDRYDLPNDAKELLRVNLIQVQEPLAGKSPAEFDAIKQATPTQRSLTPLIYCVRGGKMEVYPPPGDTYRTLEITYRKAAAFYTTASLDTVEVDWPEEWRDLLEKAIMLEASFHLADSAPVRYESAKFEYETRLKSYESLDSQVTNLAGPMTPAVGDPAFRDPWRNYRGTVYDLNGN